MAKVLPSLAKAMQLIGSLAEDITRKITCFCGFGDDLSVFSIVHDQDVRDGNKEESAIWVKGTAVDDVGIGGLGFGLN